MGNKPYSRIERLNDTTTTSDAGAPDEQDSVVDNHQRPSNAPRTPARKRSNRNLFHLLCPSSSFKKNSTESSSLAVVPSHESSPLSNGHAATPAKAMQHSGYYNHVHDTAMNHFEAKKVKRTKNAPRKSLKGNAAPTGVVGLRNLGNTCFINSSLQCLSNTIPLTDYFLAGDHLSEINKGNGLGTKGRLVMAYADLIQEMWLGDKILVEPSAFKRELGIFAPRFGGCRQHDAQELLSFLLDGIHEDLNRVQQKPYIEDRDCNGTQDEIDAILAWKNYLRRNKSLVVDLFQGQLRNTCQCLKCKHKNIRFEPFMYLSLPISNDCRALRDCMDLYLATEVLRGTNQWYCEKCKAHVDATKKIDLWILPPILIVHLKRFTYHGSSNVGSKNSATIEYPSKRWDLSADVQSKAGDPAIYDLYAVSNHSGNLGGGHYTAHALNRFDEQWYEFNDSHFRLMQQSPVVQNNPAAYVLFYNRVSDDQTSPDLTGSTKEVASSDMPPKTANGRRHPYLPLIRRQSVSRPDLWPHTQVAGRELRDFRRTSRSQLVSSLSPSKKTVTKDVEKHAPPAPVLQKERCATT